MPELGLLPNNYRITVPTVDYSSAGQISQTPPPNGFDPRYLARTSIISAIADGLGSVAGGLIKGIDQKKKEDLQNKEFADKHALNDSQVELNKAHAKAFGEADPGEVLRENVKSQFPQDVATPVGPLSGTSASPSLIPDDGVKPFAKVTDYGQASDPDLDGYTKAGKSAIGNLTSESMAVSPDVEAKLNAQGINIGSPVSVKLDNGQIVQRVWDDRTSPKLSGRVDLYSPSGPSPHRDAKVIGISPSSAPAPAVAPSAPLADTPVQIPMDDGSALNIPQESLTAGNGGMPANATVTSPLAAPFQMTLDNQPAPPLANLNFDTSVPPVSATAAPLGQVQVRDVSGNIVPPYKPDAPNLWRVPFQPDAPIRKPDFGYNPKKDAVIIPTGETTSMQFFPTENPKKTLRLPYKDPVTKTQDGMIFDSVQAAKDAGYNPEGAQLLDGGRVRITKVAKDESAAPLPESMVKLLIERGIPMTGPDGKQLDIPTASNALIDYNTKNGVQTPAQEAIAKSIQQQINSGRNPAISSYYKIKPKLDSIIENVNAKPMDQRNGVDDAFLLNTAGGIENSDRATNINDYKELLRAVGFRGNAEVTSERLWGIFNSDPKYHDDRGTRILPDATVKQIEANAVRAVNPRRNLYQQAIEPFKTRLKAHNIPLDQVIPDFDTELNSSPAQTTQQQTVALGSSRQAPLPVNSPDEYSSAPSGTWVVDSRGKIGRKP